MSRRRALLIASSVVALVAAGLALLGAPSWARVWFGLPLISVLPGYGIVCAVDPGARLGRIERLAISIGVSLALTVLIGLLVAQTSAGLTTLGWSAPLALLTLTANLVASLRSRNEDAPSRTLQLDWRKALFVTVGALWVAGVMVAALSIASEAAPKAPGQSTTAGTLQLWIQPVSGSAGTGVVIGIGNPTSAEERCHLRVTQGGTVLYDGPVVLATGQTTNVAIDNADARGAVIEAVLSTESGLTELRRVTLWPGA
ncbi:MAG: DUF1616 domain-containing protein [Coriobacteriia bacterium]